MHRSTCQSAGACPVPAAAASQQRLPYCMMSGTCSDGKWQHFFRRGLVAWCLACLAWAWLNIVLCSASIFLRVRGRMLPHPAQVYGWPFGLTRKWQRILKPYRTRWHAFWGGLWARCCSCCAKRDSGPGCV
jgi:hypothetical protein